MGNRFEGVKPTPSGVGQRLEARGFKGRSRGVQPPDPPAKSDPESSRSICAVLMCVFRVLSEATAKLYHAILF